MIKKFLATTSSLLEASEFVKSELENANCDAKPIKQILVAFEEIFVNIVHYAYPDIEGYIEIDIIAQNGIAQITFIDSGVSFNPLKKEDPDITLSIEDREIGGLRNFHC